MKAIEMHGSKRNRNYYHVMKFYLASFRILASTNILIDPFFSVRMQQDVRHSDCAFEARLSLDAGEAVCVPNNARSKKRSNSN